MRCSLLRGTFSALFNRARQGNACCPGRLLIAASFLTLNAHAGDWSRDDKHLLAATLTLHACDWAQTKEIARNQTRYYEANPLLGESPSSARVNNYFAATAIATTLAAHLMPRHRRAILTGMLVIEASVVARNQSIGISIRF